MTATAVLGEDLPVLAPLGLALLGVVAALGAASLASAAHTTPPPPAIEGATVPGADVPPEPAPRSAVSATGTAPGAPGASPPPPTPGGECPRLLVSFAWSSPAPPESSRAPIARLHTWLTIHPTATVIVDGHADGFGSDYANLELSRRRAGAVAHLVEAGGIAKGRLTVRGFGAFSPAEGTPVEAAENRRVVVHVRGGDGCPFEKEEVAQP